MYRPFDLVLFFYLDDGIRAHGCTECAAYTACLIDDNCRMTVSYTHLDVYKRQEQKASIGLA